MYCKDMNTAELKKGTILVVENRGKVGRASRAHEPDTYEVVLVSGKVRKDTGRITVTRDGKRKEQDPGAIVAVKV